MQIGLANKYANRRFAAISSQGGRKRINRSEARILRGAFATLYRNASKAAANRHEEWCERHSMPDAASMDEQADNRDHQTRRANEKS